MSSFPGIVPPSFHWLGDYYPRIWYAVAGGVFDWFEACQLAPRLALAQTSRGRPNQICDLIHLRAHEAFVDIPHEVQVDEAYETALLRFMQHGVEMKFNKLDADMRVHPPNTQRALGFCIQENLFGPTTSADEGVKLFAGYRLNVSATELMGVAITCQHFDRVIWHVEIPEPPADHQFSVGPTTPPEIGPQSDENIEGA